MQKYEAKTLDDAIAKAATDKNVSTEEIKYYVVEEKQGGLFGIGNKVVIEAYTWNDVRDFLEDYLKQYFDNINMPVEIIVTQNEDNSFKVVINAENNAILIGKNGQTLEALRTVTNSAANAQFKCRVYMNMDINGYKEEHNEKLKSTVEKIAKTVQKTHVSARLGDLTSEERKIVHQHLSTIPYIRTESEGDGPNRRLKIIYDKNKKA